MSREEIQKLLGGYATGTLTAEELRALYEAALTDQELFDAMAREEPLREVLTDPASRAQLLAAIDEAPPQWYQRWWRPMVVMATAAGLIVTLMLYTRGPKLPEMARVERPKFVPPPAASASPLMLPPPPELRTAAPPLKLLAIPLPAPKAPPPPPPRYAATAGQGFVIDGALPSNGPRQQQQQQTFQLPLPAAAPLSQPKNAMFEANTVQLDGTVTDTSGAKVAGATVAVKSLTTGDKFETTSDAKGEFKAKEPPSDQVEISASKPGFKETKVSQSTPPAGNAQPVNLRMDTAAETATVEATAAPAVPMAGGALSRRAGAGGAAIATMKSAPVPVLEYQILRTLSGRNRAEVHAEDNVPAGATLILRVTPTADGYVRIVDGSRTIASPAVRRGKAAEIALGTFAQPGHVALQVYFSRASADAKDQTAPAMTITFNVQ